MEVSLVIGLALAGLVVLLILISSCFFRMYADPNDGSKLVTFTGSLALTVSLLCLLLIPIDIFVVAFSLNSEDGTHMQLDSVTNASHSMQYIYFGLYGIMLLCAFFLLPFAYFYFEEEEEEDSFSSRCCSAMKYTVIFILIFVVLLVCGLVLIKNNAKNDNEEWISDLRDEFVAGTGVIYFSIGILSIFGLFGWVIYTAYGLAYFPVSLMKGMRNDNGHTRGESMGAPMLELETNLRNNQQEQEWLKARYKDEGASKWKPEDRIKLHKLQREERNLQTSISSSSIQLNDDSAPGCSCCAACWTILAPFRWIIGTSLLLVALLMVVSILISIIDKFLHSECKMKCGYALQKAEIVNPIDLLLTEASKIFPIDFVLFGFFALFSFVASVAGLVRLGVRLCFLKLYKIKPRKTMPHALLMGTWLLMFVVLTLNMQVLTLSPSYASFGSQFYFPVNTTTKTPCSVTGYAQAQMEGKDYCMMTQVGNFIHMLNIQLPFVGVILFVANIIFVAAFFLTAASLLICGSKDSGYMSLANDDDW